MVRAVHGTQKFDSHEFEVGGDKHNNSPRKEAPTKAKMEAGCLEGQGRQAPILRRNNTPQRDGDRFGLQAAGMPQMPILPKISLLAPLGENGHVVSDLRSDYGSNWLTRHAADSKLHPIANDVQCSASTTASQTSLGFRAV